MKLFGLVFLTSCMFLMGYYAGKNDGLFDGARGWEICQANKASGYTVENSELKCIF